MTIQTFVISLPESKERRDSCMNFCYSAGLNPIWFEAIDGKKILNRYKENDNQIKKEIVQEDIVTLNLGFGRKVAIRDKLTAADVGCALSHLRIYKRMIDENINLSLILEDDCQLSKEFEPLIPKLIETSDKWDILQGIHDSGVRDFLFKRRIYLDNSNSIYLNREGMGILDPIFNRRRGSFLTSFYFINLKAAKKLVNIGFPVRIPADYLLGLVAFHKLRLFTLFPKDKFARADQFESTIDTPAIRRPLHKLQ